MTSDKNEMMKKMYKNAGQNITKIHSLAAA